MDKESLRLQILSMKQRGMTYAEIGKVFGFTRQYAQMLLLGERRQAGPCSDCGKHSRLENHHVSYVPEVVEKLCKSCHKKRHPTSDGGGFIERATKDDFSGCSTINAYAKRIGCSVFYARELAQQLGIRLVKVGALPVEVFNWDLPNKILCDVWLGKTDPVSLIGMAGRRKKCGSPKAIRGAKWVRWTKPSDYPKQINEAIEAERAKCERWKKTESVEFLPSERRV